MKNVRLIARDLASKGSAIEGATLLEEASAGGNREAAEELSLWLLKGDMIERDLSRARRFLRQAAELGSEEATLIEVALSANGGGGPVDWASALALLRKGACDLDYLRKELQIVERLDLDDHGYPKRLPQGKVIDERLGMVRYPSFLSRDECQHLANIALGTLTPSTVFDPSTGREVSNPIRTSEGTVIGPTQEDLVFQAIFRRIAKTTGTRLEQGESLSILRYGVGQQYKPHFDAINAAPNNRIKTVLMYLNDSYEGGQTAFPDLDIVIEPKAGDALVFDGLLADGSVNRLSRHAGLPVTRGTKWVATRWIRVYPFDPWSIRNRSQLRH